MKPSEYRELQEVFTDVNLFRHFLRTGTELERKEVYELFLSVAPVIDLKILLECCQVVNLPEQTNEIPEDPEEQDVILEHLFVREYEFAALRKIITSDPSRENLRFVLERMQFLSSIHPEDTARYLTFVKMVADALLTGRPTVEDLEVVMASVALMRANQHHPFDALVRLQNDVVRGRLKLTVDRCEDLIRKVEPYSFLPNPPPYNAVLTGLRELKAWLIKNVEKA